MAKRQLSKLQQRRVKEKHNKKLSLDAFQDEGEFLAAQDGVVISRFGKVADVENQQGEIYRCNIRRTLSSIVTGDRVVWRENADAKINGVIEAVQPRTSELVRPDFYDGIKAVAANVDQIVIISSVLPELSLNILDRYLVACHATNIEPIIVLNKIDLLSDAQWQEVNQIFAYYAQLGYSVLKISCQQKLGLEDLLCALQDRVSILVGQSGVGKSSIINELFHEVIQVDVGDISTVSGLGQHTTTSTKLYHLPFGGDIIDSPGIREFGLWHLEPEQVMNGFKELCEHLGNCRFRDCNHLDDPNCGLQTAVAEGKIAAWRLDNYHRILQSMREVKAKTNRNFKLI